MPVGSDIRREGSSADYRRHARRLRKQYADEPGRLHQRLQELARQHDTWRSFHGQEQRTDAPAWQRAVVRRVLPPMPRSIVSDDAQQEVLDRFAEVVTSQIEGPVLRYSQRARLLRLAERLGIGRFHANLIIALIQHQTLSHQPALAEPSGVPSHISRIARFALAGLVQGAILWGIWRLMHG